MRLLLSFLFFGSILTAQTTFVHGVITDGSTKQPLVAATIFVSNTTYKTVSDEQGYFSITVPESDYELVVTFVGYAPLVFKSALFPDRLKRYPIELFTETQNLSAVTVLSEKDRARLLKYFVDNLIGTSKNAEKTKITNLSDVVLEMDYPNNILVASCDTPLEIENPELNYHLTFVLSYFQVDFKNNISQYAGYPSFRELKPLEQIKPKRIRENRQRAYLGSAMHFARAVFRNTFIDEGFTVRSFTKTANPDYDPSPESLKEKHALAVGSDKENLLMNLRKPYIIKFGKRNLYEGDFVRKDGNKKSLHIFDHLEITYTKEKIEENYFSHQYDKEIQISQLQANNQNIPFFENGYISAADEMIFYGYMGWEKLADMLPFDYIPD